MKKENINQENKEEKVISNEEQQEEEVKESKEEVKNNEEVNGQESNQENKEYEKIKDSYLRLQADFANYKRRQEKEKQDIYKFASEKLITKLLSVLDNFERALVGVEKEDKFVEGIKLVQKELEDILKSEGIEEIESDGKLFDANLHHAVFMEESDEVESEHIIETFQKGYKLKGKVIRPSMVKVSK